MLCILCTANCDSCGTAGCLNCSAGFTLTNGTCLYADTCGNYTGMDGNCVDCTTVTSPTVEDQCTACQEGFYLFSNTACLACPSTCISCNSFYNCSLCQPTFNLVSGLCSCNSLSNEVNYNGACVVCSSLFTGCQTCNSTTCFSCSTGYVDIGGGTCASCALGCAGCLVNGSCTGCLPGYTLDGSLACSGALCASNQFYDPNTPPNCFSCPTNCTTCTSSTSCLSCSPTFSLINGACLCD